LEVYLFAVAAVLVLELVLMVGQVLLEQMPVVVEILVGFIIIKA
jgi:hypothetical protein